MTLNARIAYSPQPHSSQIGVLQALLLFCSRKWKREAATAGRHNNMPYLLCWSACRLPLALQGSWTIEYVQYTHSPQFSTNAGAAIPADCADGADCIAALITLCWCSQLTCLASYAAGSTYMPSLSHFSESFSLPGCAAAWLSLCVLMHRSTSTRGNLPSSCITSGKQLWKMHLYCHPLRSTSVSLTPASCHAHHIIPSHGDGVSIEVPFDCHVATRHVTVTWQRSALKLFISSHQVVMASLHFM